MGDPTGFHMQYRLFGSPVCRDAFIALTGIHAATLQEARGTATGDRPPPLPPGLGIWVMRRPLAYISARAWLLFLLCEAWHAVLFEAWLVSGGRGV